MRVAPTEPHRPAIAALQIVDSSLNVELQGAVERNVLVGDNGQATFTEGHLTEVTTTDLNFQTP